MDRVLVQGTTGDDTLTATGTVRVDGLAGNDLVQSTLASDLTVVWGPGGGRDTVSLSERAEPGQVHPAKRIELPAGLFTEDVYWGQSVVFDPVTGTPLDTERVRVAIGGTSDWLYVSQPDLWQLQFSGNGEQIQLTGNGFSTSSISGTAGPDTIVGASPLNHDLLIYGDDGNDRLSLGQKGVSALLSGDAGDDTLEGGAFGDTLRGGVGNDLIQGNGGGDLIRFLPGWGQDTVVADDLDVIALGAGITRQTLSFSETDAGAVIAMGSAGDALTLPQIGSWDGLRLRFADGSEMTGQEVRLSLQGVSWVGSDAADEFIGTALSDQLEGAGGSDVLRGLGGADVILGGLGNDRLEGGEGDDRLEGGAGDDTLVGGRGLNRLVGGDGADVFWITDEVATHMLGTDALDVLRFGPGISAHQVSWQLPWPSSGVTGEPGAVRVERAPAAASWVVRSEGGGPWAAMVFEDGVRIDHATARMTGTDGNDTLSHFGDVKAGRGDDVIGLAPRLNASGAAFWSGRTVLYDLGDGHDTVGSPLPDMPYNAVRFGEGIGPSDVRVGLDTVRQHTSLLIHGGAGSLAIDGIGDVTFADGTVWKRGDLFNLRFTQQGLPVPVSHNFSESSGAVPESLSEQADFCLGNDTLGDTIFALGGNDEVWGGGGNDSLLGGLGNDTLVGEAGNDTLAGESGADQYWVSAQQGDDTLLIDGQDALWLRRMAREDVTFQSQWLDGEAVWVARLAAGGTVTLKGLSAASDFKVRFDDGTTLGWQDITGLAQVQGTANADTLTAVGRVHVDGRGGNDLIQSTLASELVVRLAPGGATDTIRFEQAAQSGVTYPTKTIEVDASIFPEDVLVTGAVVFGADGSVTDRDRLEVKVFGLGAQPSLYLYDLPLWQFKFLSDGSVRPLVFNMSEALVTGTSGADSLTVGDTSGVKAHGFGGDGNDSLSVGFSRTAVVLSGDAGDDRLFGGAGADTLRGGQGNDLIDGGLGADLIRFQRGGGQDTVHAGEGDVLALGPTIRQADLWFTLWNDDVLMGIAGGTDSVLLKGLGQWDSLTVRTSDGATRSGADIFRALGGVNAVGTEQNDLLQGADLPDSLVGAQGQDTLQGWGGIDRLFGGGDDDLLDGGDGDDLLDGGSGNDTLHGGGGRNELIGGDGADTFVISSQVGTQVLTTDAVDLIRFEGDVTARQVSFVQRVSTSSNVTVGKTIVTRTDPEGAYTFNTDGQGAWSKAIFADGSYLDGRTGVLTGTSGNDTLSFYGGVQAGQGDDVILFSPNVTPQGFGWGGLVVFYNAGDGHDVVSGEAISTTRHTIRMGEGILPSDVKVGIDTSPNHASLTFRHIAGGLEVDHVGAVYFADGTVWQRSDLFNLKYTQQGLSAPVVTDNSWTSGTTAALSLSAQADAYLGSDAGNDVVLGQGGHDELWGQRGDDSLSGGLGNDQLAGGLGNDTLVGDGGADRYVVRSNEGNDLIRADSLDVLALRGMTRDDVRFGALGATATDALVMSFRQGGSVTLEKFSQAPGFKVVFDDGLTLGWSDLTGRPAPAEGLSLTGTSKADNLKGSGGSDTLSGLAGNDTLAGGAGNDVLQGGKGNDTYMFARGDGQDLVQENDSTWFNSDVVKFSADIGARQLWFSKSGSNLEVSVMGSADKVTVQDWFKGSAYRVEKFASGDGKTLTASKVDALVNAMASFTPPPSATALPANAPAALTRLVASSWT